MPGSHRPNSRDEPVERVALGVPVYQPHRTARTVKSVAICTGTGDNLTSEWHHFGAIAAIRPRPCDVITQWRPTFQAAAR
jgi:hypothetical protein